MSSPVCYVYEITDRQTGMWYVGCRTAKGCHPSDLGGSYFTSSRVVKPLFRADPDRFEKKILVIGPPEYILDLEHKILVQRNARLDPGSYNMFNAAEGFNPVKIGKVVAAENQRLGRAIFAQTLEEKRATGYKGGKVAGPRGGKTQGLKNIDNGVLERARAAINWDSVRSGASARLKAISSEKRSTWAKNAAAKNWRCDECGLAGNAGTIGYHQKASGHRGRIKNV